MAENFYTEILFQGLTTRLKTDGDVLRYTNALTALFSAGNFKSYERCVKSATILRDNALNFLKLAYSIEIEGINDGFFPPDPNSEAYALCVASRDFKINKALDEYDAEEQKIIDEYNKRLAECARVHGKPDVVLPGMRQRIGSPIIPGFGVQGVGISTGRSVKTKT